MSEEREWRPFNCVYAHWERSLLEQTEYRDKYGISAGSWASWNMGRSPNPEGAAAMCIATRGEIDLADWLEPEQRAAVLEHPPANIGDMSLEALIERWSAMVPDEKAAVVSGYMAQHKGRRLERPALVHIATQGQVPMIAWLEPPLRTKVVNTRKTRAMLLAKPSKKRRDRELLFDLFGRTTCRSLARAEITSVDQLEAMTWRELCAVFPRRDTLCCAIRDRMYASGRKLRDTTLRELMAEMGYSDQGGSFYLALAPAGIETLEQVLAIPDEDLDSLGLGYKTLRTLRWARGYHAAREALRKVCPEALADGQKWTATPHLEDGWVLTFTAWTYEHVHAKAVAWVKEDGTVEWLGSAP